MTPIDTATDTAGTPIKTGAAPYWVAMASTPNGKTVYVLNLGDGELGKATVTPIDTKTNIAGKPIPIEHAAFPDLNNLMVITPNGKTIYAAGNTTLIPINTATNTVGKPIKTGLQPVAIAITTGHPQR